jgi:hypothetical protein
MRSAGLVGAAQTIACCGEIGGIGRRCEIAQRRVRPSLVVIVDLVRDLGPGMVKVEVEVEEQALVEKLVAHAPVGQFAAMPRRTLLPPSNDVSACCCMNKLKILTTDPHMAPHGRSGQ